MAELRAARSAESVAAVLGHTVAGDGGGGVFIRVPGEKAADDDTIQVIDLAGQLWRRFYSGPIDVRWAGARCDGKGDDSAAIAKAARAGPILVSTGVCRIASSLELSSHARMEAGASILIEQGATVTFAAGLEAPLAQIFRGSGAVRLDPRFCSIGYPEWWGAKGWLPGQPAPGPDCLAALTACVEACPVTELQAVDYWVSSTWKINSDSRVIRGIGVNAQGPNLATRVIVHSHDLDVVQIGPDRQPCGGVSAFLSRVEFGHITCARSLPPGAPADGFGGPSGLRVQFSQNIQIHDVWSLESTNGFYLCGAVYCAFDRCFAARVNPGAASINDYFAGFLLDANDRIGMNTGLASIYIRNKCGAHGGVHASPTYGIRTLSGCTDLFIDAFETASIEFGMFFDGESPTVYPSENLRVSNCVLDQVKTGVTVRRGNAATNITLINNYCAPTHAGGSIGFLVEQTPSSGPGGAVSLLGNEVIGGGGGAVGLMVDGASGVITTGNLFTDLNRPIVLNGASDCRIADRISNVAQRGMGPAIEFASASQCVVDAILGGAPGIFQVGVALALSRKIEVRCSGIDGKSVAGAKLTADGRPVAAAGPFGAGNLAQGLLN
ncbi:MAG TPA: hypothetical protein VGF71_06545 [Caulobacteraceae bacterium]